MSDRIPIPFYSLTSWYYYLGLFESLEILIVDKTDDDLFIYNDIRYILVYNLYNPRGPGLGVMPIYQNEGKFK